MVENLQPLEPEPARPATGEPSRPATGEPARPTSGEPTRPTVALVDTLWIGHHPMYFGQFTASFLRAGARVIGLCPDPDAAVREAEHAGVPADRRDHVSMHELPAGGRSWFNGRFEGDPLRTLQRWQRTAERLRAAEKATGWHADLVYFPYLDSFLRFLPLSSIPEVTIDRPWSGLYLRNHHHRHAPSLLHRLRLIAKGDAILRSPLCRGIGVLDERFIETMERYSGLRVDAFPDATRTERPEQPPARVNEVLAAAAGRRIIGLIGLEKRKGALNMMRVARLAAEAGKPWYFVFAGTFGLAEFSPGEQRWIERFIDDMASGVLDNVHFDPEAPRIPTEAEFNALFASFDLAWAAYEGFQGSSGTLSKAAAFEIPTLATAGECIGERVARYRIGLTIQEGDSEAAFEAIGRLLDGADWNRRPLDPDYASFRDDHSIGRLDQLLAEMVARMREPG